MWLAGRVWYLDSVTAWNTCPANAVMLIGMSAVAIMPPDLDFGMPGLQASKLAGEFAADPCPSFSPPMQMQAHIARPTISGVESHQASPATGRTQRCRSWPAGPSATARSHPQRVALAPAAAAHAAASMGPPPALGLGLAGAQGWQFDQLVIVPQHHWQQATPSCPPEVKPCPWFWTAEKGRGCQLVTGCDQWAPDTVPHTIWRIKG
jgi:hypothetical protein